MPLTRAGTKKARLRELVGVWCGGERVGGERRLDGGGKANHDDAATAGSGRFDPAESGSATTSSTPTTGVAAKNGVDPRGEATASSPTDSDPDGEQPQQHVLSAYEQLRLRNIKRNNARLRELGLLDNPTFAIKPSPPRRQGTPPRKPRPRKAPVSLRKQPPRMVRSSLTKVRIRIVSVTTRELRDGGRKRKGPGRPRRDEYITTVTKVMTVI